MSSDVNKAAFVSLSTDPYERRGERRDYAMSTFKCFSLSSFAFTFFVEIVNYLRHNLIEILTNRFSHSLV